MIKNYEDFKFEDNVVGLDDVSITYLQNGDCEDERDNVQSITLTTQNNGVDRFITIKTDRWAIDDTEQLIEIIEDFKKRAELCGGNC